MLLLVGAGHSVGVGLGVPVVVVVVFVAVVLVVVGGGSGAVVVVWALWLSLLFFVQGFRSPKELSLPVPQSEARHSGVQSPHASAM